MLYEVITDLSADGIKLSLKSTLTVTEATPYLEQVSAQPGSGSPYNPAGITLSTTISHPTNNAVDKPQGNVEFFVDGDSKGEATLDNGLATLPNIVLTSGTTHSIYAKYLGTSDPNYTEATSSTISYEVEKITPQDGVNYTLSTPNGDNGWYNRITSYNVCYTKLLRKTTDKFFDTESDACQYIYEQLVN